LLKIESFLRLTKLGCVMEFNVGISDGAVILCQGVGSSSEKPCISERFLPTNNAYWEGFRPPNAWISR
jgi:hypothetical protein